MRVYNATPKQIGWMRSSLRRGLRGTDPAMSADSFADRTIYAILGVWPQAVARHQVGEAVEQIEDALNEADVNQYDYAEPEE